MAIMHPLDFFKKLIQTIFRPDMDDPQPDVDVAILEALADTPYFEGKITCVLEYAFTVVYREKPSRELLNAVFADYMNEHVVPLWARDFTKHDRCKELCERHGIEKSMDIPKTHKHAKPTQRR